MSRNSSILLLAVAVSGIATIGHGFADPILKGGVPGRVGYQSGGDADSAAHRIRHCHQQEDHPGAGSDGAALGFTDTNAQQDAWGYSNSIGGVNARPRARLDRRRSKVAKAVARALRVT